MRSSPSIRGAIGTQLAFPGRQVISMSGDDRLAMLTGDLLMITQYDLQIKVVVFDNSALAWKLEMELAGLPDWQTDLKNPDFSKLAEAISIIGNQDRRSC